MAAPAPSSGTGNREPIDFETALPALKITGDLPKWLNGILVRNGPNPLFPSDHAHWFEGDGMLHAFSLSQGTASYRNCWVRTKRWQAQQLHGCALDPQTESEANQSDGAANTNVIWHGKRLLALEEAHLPIEVSLPLLQTQGACDFGGKLQGSFTAHPKKDPATGELHFFGYGTPEPLSAGMVYGVIDADNNVVRLDAFQAPYPSMVHDMVITKNYVVIPVMPLTASAQRAAESGVPFVWDPALSNKIGVFRRDLGPQSIRWFDGPASYVFHFMNAWEEGPHLYVDGMQARRAPLFPAVDGSMPAPDQAAATLCRWHFHMESSLATYDQTRLDDLPGEFPRMDERYTGRAYRHGWFCGHAGTQGEKFNAIVHFDHRRRRRSVYPLPQGDSASEVVFVPHYDMADEGDGCLLAVVYRAGEDRSDLVVFDALEVDAGPVATAQLPHRVPMGFHGNWVDATELAQARG